MCVCGRPTLPYLCVCGRPTLPYLCVCVVGPLSPTSVCVVGPLSPTILTKCILCVYRWSWRGCGWSTESGEWSGCQTSLCDWYSSQWTWGQAYGDLWDIGQPHCNCRQESHLTRDSTLNNCIIKSRTFIFEHC